MTKKKIYICLTISFLVLTYLALKFGDLLAGFGAIILFISLIEDKDWYLEEEKKPGDTIKKTFKTIKKFGSMPDEINFDKLPIVITTHAQDRLNKRFHCNKSKYLKIAKKAWKSKEQMNDKLFKKVTGSDSARPGDMYRFYLGYVFVFRRKKYCGEHNISLITLYNPKVID